VRVVIAPDKFKGCLTAGEVADALAEGLLSAGVDVQVTRFPVADGGDGTVAAALSRGFTEVPVEAAGPTGVPGPTAYARRGELAVIELAAVCGLDRLPGGRPDPLGATTYGLGTVVRHAITAGATRIVLGLGGSASTDGGAGLVQALGGHLLDDAGRELPPGGAALARLARLDLEDLRATMAGVSVVLANDVDNPLLGPRGAAAVFGPQKGATAGDVATLEAALRHWADCVQAQTGAPSAATPGAGAAGGTGFAALAVLGADRRDGIELILELLDFEAALAGADLVITGEGALDEQTLAGKAPIGVARAARRAGVPVVAVAGRNDLSDAQLARAGIQNAYPLSALEPDLRRSLAQAEPLLRRIGTQIAADHVQGES
jgi:glycerate kinase